MDDILQRQEATLTRLPALVKGLSEAELAWRPAPNKWSAKEIVCHLADVELMYGARYRWVLAEDQPLLLPFDQDAFARALGYAQDDLQAALEQFRVLRRRNLSLLTRLLPTQGERIGLHQQRGAITLRSIAESIAAHDENHLRQIEERIRGARAASR